MTVYKMKLSEIPDSHAYLLTDEARAFAYLATIMDDGTPQVTPVWFNTDGDFIFINSVEGRVKDHNIRKRPHVTVLIHNTNDPYYYIQVRGKVVDIINKGARQHIDELAGKYTGTPVFRGMAPTDVRVIYKIRPDKVNV